MAIGQEFEKEPAAPVVIESGEITFLDHDEQTVLDATGPYSSCDVWIRASQEWRPDVEITVYARLGSIATPITSIRLRDVRMVTRGSFQEGIVASVRGRPCTGFEVTARSVSIGDSEPVDGTGTFAMQVWSSRETLSATTGTAPGSETSPQHQRIVRDRAAFGITSPAIVAGPTTAATTVNVAHLWRSETKEIQIQRIIIAHSGGDDGGTLWLRGTRTTSEGSGGTEISGVPLDISDTPTAAGRLAPTEAPAPDADLFAYLVKGATTGVLEWNADLAGKPIVLRRGKDEGFTIRGTADVAFSTGMKLTVSFQWLEI